MFDCERMPAAVVSNCIQLKLQPFPRLCDMLNECNVEIWDFLRGMHRVHGLVRLRGGDRCGHSVCVFCRYVDTMMLLQRTNLVSPPFTPPPFSARNLAHLAAAAAGAGQASRTYRSQASGLWIWIWRIVITSG